MIFLIIKRIVYILCLVYSVNIIISKSGKYVPINYYTIIFVYFFDIFAILAIIYLRYYS